MNNTSDPMLQLLGRPDGPLAGASLWQLEVVGAGLLTPRMRRIEFTAPDLGDLVHQPGQDLMLRIPSEGRTVNRRYTIRSLDRDRAVLVVDAVVHGEGVGSHWLTGAVPGDRLEAVGPRGKIGVAPDVAWHLFAGDESALPAMLAMAESVPGGSRAIVLAEVADAGEELTLPGEAIDVRWLHRGPAEPGRSSVLSDTLAAFPLPAGPGHIYLAGEATAVTVMRGIVLERGVPSEQLSAKAYWSRGRANAAHGEPERMG
jgi:NADPH-dependent ferric siderophore reductase